MTIHRMAGMTAGAMALAAAGIPFERRDGGEPIEMLTKSFETHNAEILKKLGASDEVIAEVKSRLDELEQKAARGGGGGGAGSHETAADSWGAQIANETELRDFGKIRRPTRLRMEVKGTLTTSTTSAGTLDVPHRDNLVGMARRRLPLRALLPTAQVESGSIQYAKEKTRTFAAATVVEGAVKPESDFAFEMKDAIMRVIAHWVPASRQILDDAPQLAGFIDQELRYGLALREEAQILSGDGTGQNLFGLIPQATVYAAPFTVSGETLIDRIGLGILQVANADFVPTGVVMHPTDWMKVLLTKDAGGNYVLGNPGTQNAASIWGLPVVPTPGIAAGRFLIGDFATAATLYDRWEATVEVSTDHADFFIRNLVAILAEERIGLAVKQAGAMVTGTFS